MWISCWTREITVGVETDSETQLMTMRVFPKWSEDFLNFYLTWNYFPILRYISCIKAMRKFFFNKCVFVSLSMCDVHVSEQVWVQGGQSSLLSAVLETVTNRSKPGTRLHSHTHSELPFLWRQFTENVFIPVTLSMTPSHCIHCSQSDPL